MSDVKPLTAEEIKTYKECLYPLPTPLKRALATIHQLRHWNARWGRFAARLHHERARLREENAKLRREAIDPDSHRAIVESHNALEAENARLAAAFEARGEDGSAWVGMCDELDELREENAKLKKAVLAYFKGNPNCYCGFDGECAPCHELRREARRLVGMATHE